MQLHSIVRQLRKNKTQTVDGQLTTDPRNKQILNGYGNYVVVN